MTTPVVIAGGGTGGHLFPGIALARALMRYDSDIEITFVGTRQGIESKILPREGLRLHTILSSGLLGKRGLGRFFSWLKLPVGWVQSLAFLVRSKARLVVGVGGYVSGPLVLAAWTLRIPILIHEQNAVPGVTNRILGRLADIVAVSFSESRKYFPAGKRVVETGNMIRQEFSAMPEPQSIPTDPFRLLVLGGSQGAHSINRAMVEALDSMAEVKDHLHIVHQTGETDAASVQQAYTNKGFSGEVHAFIEDMARHYRQASLVISRAGATSLAEITAAGKAAILIPFPFAAHNHQEFNARALESAGAAEIILDRELSGKRLAERILDLMQNPERLMKMNRKSYQLGKRDATEKVKALCVELIKQAA